jgi:hypothetical protein
MKKALHLPRGWIPLYRVVCRSFISSGAGGGVSFALCGYDSSSADTNIGSRLGINQKEIMALCQEDEPQQKRYLYRKVEKKLEWVEFGRDFSRRSWAR